MPTELEELVEFIHHGNTPIRQIAVENLVPYSVSEPAIFKTNQLRPINDLKLLVKDYEDIAKNAITILINLSADRDVLQNLATDDKFLKVLVGRLVKPSEPNADLLAMLLANMAKWDELKSILTAELVPPKELCSSRKMIDQLLGVFVKGAEGSYNPKADFDYLAYLFADLAKQADGRRYFVTRQDFDNVVPLTKITVFTEHKSDVRRRGVASTIKNVAFDVPSHPALLAEDEINILPYLLLPITGSEEYSEDETMDMLPDLQLLPPDKRRDDDPTIIQTHIETLTLLTSTREGRELQRSIQVYPIIRETHGAVPHDGVQEACDRLVQVLMRDEADGDDGTAVLQADTDTHIEAAAESDSDDDKMVAV